MENHLKPIKRKLRNISCPHLSLVYDAATYAAYPSINNACYRGKRPETPKISHQRTYCLSPLYRDCPFLNNEENKKFPEEIKYKLKGQNTKIIISILALLTAVVIIYTGVKGCNASGGSAGKPSQTPSMSQNDLPADTPRGPDLAPVDTISPTSAPMSIASPMTITPTKSDPVLALETPIGGQNQFIIHRVLEGESLQYFADRYNTSVETILAVNKNLIRPLWVGSIVVIPVNTEESSEIPALLAHQIEEEGITVSLVAEKFSVPKEQLAFYNNIEAEHSLHQGEWLLIPQE